MFQKEIPTSRSRSHPRGDAFAGMRERERERERFRRALDADGEDQFCERRASSRGNIVDIYVLFRATTTARVRVSERHTFLEVPTFTRDRRYFCRLIHCAVYALLSLYAATALLSFLQIVFISHLSRFAELNANILKFTQLITRNNRVRFLSFYFCKRNVPRTNNYRSSFLLLWDM